MTEHKTYEVTLRIEPHRVEEQNILQVTKVLQRTLEPISRAMHPEIIAIREKSK